MNKIFDDYIGFINDKLSSGIAREHAYRGIFENLIQSILPAIKITNEPSKITECGNPDFVLMAKDIPVGYIEAKDIGKDLFSKNFNEQFNRYKNALDNLIITDYVHFLFYQNGELIHDLKIAEIENNKVIPLTQNYEKLLNLIKDFPTFVTQTIRSPKKLAELMAGKARLLQNILWNSVESDEKTAEDTSLKEQYQTFKDILIHDLTPKQFSDIYAQTLAYGMFAARLHDPTLHDFSRQEAAELIPKSNPFLRKLFHHVAGPDIDDRIIVVVDNLAEVFRATDVEKILRNFGKRTKTHDPIIHFYETFLTEYDPTERAKRGVWYTPEPVVKFIIRAVDSVLKSEFDLREGLASDAKTKVKVELQGTSFTKGRKKGKAVYEEKEVHKVQILDPATGTGTFLAEVVRYIYESKFESMEGIWPNYVEHNLCPRLNGFELLMASYSMAHLKLDLLLKEMGCKVAKDQRFNIYLTNSLEEHHKDTGTLFSQFLSTEANEANSIKRDCPVMCIIGNPPYRAASTNDGEWIMKLMEDYKKEPGGKEKLKERNPKWLNDDYVKFIRYGQHFIEKNGEGVLAFINPHGFLDNPTFRGMRWNLLKVYDQIYTIDLHGNSNKKEKCLDGSKDENIFDIQQGVSINIFIKTGLKKENELGQVFHHEIYGKRNSKYEFLTNADFLKIPYKKISPKEPSYFFTNINYDLKDKYDAGFQLTNLFPLNGVGITTAHDSFVIDLDKEVLLSRFIEFKNSPPDSDYLHHHFSVKKKKGWNILDGWNNLQSIDDLEPLIKEINYRPFDKKYIFFEDKLVWRSVNRVMKHLDFPSSLGLVSARSNKSQCMDHFFVTSSMMETKFGERTTQSCVFPLFLNYEDEVNLDSESLNLNYKIIETLERALNLTFTKSKFNEYSLFDYIYAVLYSNKFRLKYSEFLKADFPKIPYPETKDIFLNLVKLGGELRLLHLLEHPDKDCFITTYSKPGENVVTRKMSKKDIGYESRTIDVGKVWINDEQYFDNVPLVAWEFTIGGYQPAQKWLKDRINSELSYNDIIHYQRIIVSLKKTHDIMGEIDKIDFL